MKCRMVVSGLLCLWAVSQITMPPSAEAGSWHDKARTKALGLPELLGVWDVSNSLDSDVAVPSVPGLGSDSNSGPGTSVTEHNLPNPAVCKGGYRWGRVNPDDFITKIYC